ncbi:MAG: LTA synthase family protein [Alphaproteobacteria bacterium]|nr:LTA synthase family protein [Alphaproteobacteria bacterium]
MTHALHFFGTRIAKPTFFFLICEFLVRGYLLWLSNIDHIAFFDIIKIFLLGLSFDVIVLSFFLIPLAMYIMIMPGKRQGGDKEFRLGVFSVFALTILFTSLAEIIFWEEFSARFNFIAVDYLVYTHEVLRNIYESYNLSLLFGGLFSVLALIVGCVYFFDRKKIEIQSPSFKGRALTLLCVIIASFLLYMTAPIQYLGAFHSQIHRELAQNGIFSLFSAFFQNSLSYNQFYLTEEDLKNRNISLFVPSIEVKTSKKAFHQHNVIIVLMESMSAEFMATFGNKENLTPELDKLAKKGVLFSKLYATGTRTVRGIEALILGVPPSPGQSIVKRPENENLRSIGFVFKENGYDTRFIYGGNAYFDNMEHFFSTNGFDVVEHKDFKANEIHFENAWGICDEDLFKKTISEADQSFDARKPFMLFALTTSNHRPYTYPEGKINLAPKVTGRSGGVKYADYAVGQLVAEAKTKPWFDNTIFVFIADHTHGTTGRLEITPEKHHIPCIIYAPKIMNPNVVDSMCSQIDIPATVMGILGIPFHSDFAEDVLHHKPNRAFISNFQKLGYLEGDVLTVLKPVKDVSIYNKETVVDELFPYKTSLAKAVYFFSKASNWKDTLRR